MHVDITPAVANVSQFIRQGQHRKAIPELERILSVEPSDARLRLTLADLLSRSDASTQAADQLCQVARRYERDGSALKAMAVYMQVLRIQRGHREAALALGRHYAEHGLFHEAAEAFGQALAEAKDPAARLPIIQALLDLDPENIADRLRLAEAYSAQGALQDAAREFRRVAESLDRKATDEVWAQVVERLVYYQPDDVALAKRLAAHYLGENAPQLALPRLRKAFEARPRDVEVMGLLVDTFNLLGQIQKSVAVLKEMARLYDQSGLGYERAECWQRILALDPNDREAREALESSRNEFAGQTFDLPLHQFEEQWRGQVGPMTAPHPRPQPGEFEPGFEDEAENTIIDDVFMPDLLRRHQAGLALKMSPIAENPLADAREEIDTVAFLISTGQIAEAETQLNELRRTFGDRPELLALAARLKGGV